MALIVPARSERNVQGDYRIGGDLYVLDDVAVTGDIAGSGTNSGGFKVPVLHAATTLTAAQSGGTCFFDTAAGQLYTLPPAEEGLYFKFIVVVTATSLVHRVACTTGDFMLGTFAQSTDSTYTEARHAANGSTHLAWEGNGSTKGGIIGDVLEVWGRDGTVWLVNGRGSATGAEATPFVTS